MAFWLSHKLLRQALEFRFPTSQFFSSFSASLLMMAVVLGCHYTGWPWYVAPLYVFLGLAVFSVVVSLTNSRGFFETLNSVSPVRLVDPIRWLFQRRSNSA